jgi:hypothetical protein
MGYMGRLAIVSAIALGLVAGSATVSLAKIVSPALTPREIPGYGIEVGLPAGWLGARPPASAAAVGIKYIYRAPDVTSGFAANLNVIVAPLPAGMTLREWFFSGGSSAYQYVGTTTAATIGGARGLHYKSTKAAKYGSIPLLTDEYAVARDGHVFLFTYTALASDRAQYQRVFTDCAKSIRLSAHPLAQVKS